MDTVRHTDVDNRGWSKLSGASASGCQTVVELSRMMIH